MSNISLHSLSSMKQSGEKFTVLTAYDATFSHVVSSAGVEVILVGDSLGMVLQGHDSTLPVSIEDMIYHTKAVMAGNQGSFIMADMPFMSYATSEQAMANAGELMKAGANIVKLEGGAWLEETTRVLTERGVPVCAHLGLTPQMVNKLGGYRVQGRDTASADQMIADAVLLQDAGASMILLECIPSSLGKALTQAVDIPVIGIGAGPDTDAQVLVLQDILGITVGRIPRFVKNFLDGQPSIHAAVEAYVNAVKTGDFPAAEHGFD